MTQAPATGLRSIDLAVRDLAASNAFYREVWGLTEVSRDAGSIYLRGSGGDHHLLGLHQAPRSALKSINFAASDSAAVDAIHARATALGAEVLDTPHQLPEAAGGGYGFALRSPEGQTVSVSADVANHSAVEQDGSRPERLSHVVINAARYDEQMAFFQDVLGFRLSDTTVIMDFLRCCSDHHSIALARAEGASLNHIAYELPAVEGLLRGAGRLRQSGFDVAWGIGRHGPGDNVFSYFVEPNGFVTEYTTGMTQIVDDDYPWHGPDYWNNFGPCRWGLADAPTPDIRRAMHGLVLAERNERCEEIIAKGLHG